METINATSLLDQAEVLGNASRAALDDLKNITESLTTLVNLQENISSELNSIKQNLDGICPQLPFSHRCDTSGLELKVNFSGLNLRNQLNKVSDAQNISESVAIARKQFKVSLKDVQNNLGESLKQVQSIRTQVQDKLKNISTVADPVIDILDSYLRWTNGSKDLINEIGTYTWYSTTSLSCLLMLTILLYYIGILLGLCGKRLGNDGNDGQSCNKGTGAFCIVCGSAWAGAFYWLLMLIVILLFSSAGWVYALGCRYLNGGVEGVKTFDSLFTDPIRWSWGPSLQNISSALENCKENKGLYTAIHLFDKTINLEELINVTEINQKVREVAEKQINMSDTNLLTSDLEKQLSNFGNTTLNSINFTEFFYQTDLDNVAGTNLSQFAHSLNITADPSTTLNNSVVNSLRQQSYRLVLLTENQIAQFSVKKDLLRTRVRSLEEKSSFTTQTTDLIKGLQTAQEHLNKTAPHIMKQALNQTVNTVLGNINITVSNIIHQLKNDIGHCRPAYDAVQGISDSVCITVLNPLNGFWFGLGCTLFFFIPSTIFGDILNWLLRKKRPYEKNETDDSPDRNAYSRDFQDKMPEGQGPHVYSGYAQDNIPLRQGPHAYSGHVQDNIALRHDRNAYSRHFQDKIPEGHGPIAYSGQVQDNIPLIHYPQRAVPNVYHNPSFEPDLNRQSSPAGRPQQVEGSGQYVDYREMTSNYAVVHPERASRQVSYYDGEQPGNLYPN